MTKSASTALHPLALTLICLVLHQAPAQAEREWLMAQKQAYFGFQKIYFTHDALKIVNETLGFSMVSKAPDWRVIGFRNDDKVIRASSLSAYLKEHNYNPSQRMAWYRAWNKVGSSSAAGMLVTKYAVAKGKDPTGQRTFVLKIDDPPVADELCDVLNAYYKSSPCKGIAYGSSAYLGPPPKQRRLGSWSNSIADEESGQRELLKTLSLKAVPYKQSDFDCPTGYKQVGSYDEITAGKSTKQSIDSMLDDLGFGSKLGH